jgi:hypothetical protein
LKLAAQEKEQMKKDFEQEKERLFHQMNQPKEIINPEAQENLQYRFISQTISVLPFQGYSWEIHPKEIQLGRLLGQFDSKSIYSYFGPYSWNSKKNFLSQKIFFVRDRINFFCT